MLPTVNLSRQFAAPYESQIAFDQACEEAAAASDLPPVLFELVKVRVAQLNGCAFCLRMHSRDAVRAGATAEQLAVLAAWWESQYFSGQEQAAFTIAERITHIGEAHTAAPPAVDVAAALDERQIAAVSWVAIAINAWNRIAIASHYPVGP
jgi:AhpD family alkylhydroperoxidase